MSRSRSSFSSRGVAQLAVVRTSVTRSGSAKANTPGAFGAAFGRGGRWRETAFIGTSIHGFSASARQHTKRHSRARAGGTTHVGKGSHGVAEEHHAEGRRQQIVCVQRGRGGIDLPPSDIGNAGSICA